MWDDLDIQQKSELMRLFIKNNIYSLDKMKEIYNDTTERQYSSGGQIHIEPSKRGTFKAKASRMGMTVQEAASHILANKGNYSPAMVKKANFARNFAHADGGNLFFTGGPKKKNLGILSPNKRDVLTALGVSLPEEPVLKQGSNINKPRAKEVDTRNPLQMTTDALHWTNYKNSNQDRSGSDLLWTGFTSAAPFMRSVSVGTNLYDIDKTMQALKNAGRIINALDIADDTKTAIQTPTLYNGLNLGMNFFNLNPWTNHSGDEFIGSGWELFNGTKDEFRNGGHLFVTGGKTKKRDIYDKKNRNWYGDIIGGELAQDASKQNGAFTNIDLLENNGYLYDMKNNNYVHKDTERGQQLYGEQTMLRASENYPLWVPISLGLTGLGAGIGATAGIGAGNTIGSKVLSGINAFNNTQIGKVINAGLAADGIYNLTTGNGIKKTIDLFSKGDYPRATLSLMGDVLDATGTFDVAKYIRDTGKKIFPLFKMIKNGVEYNKKAANVAGNVIDFGKNILYSNNINWYKLLEPKNFLDDYRTLYRAFYQNIGNINIDRERKILKDWLRSPEYLSRFNSSGTTGYLISTMQKDLDRTIGIKTHFPLDVNFIYYKNKKKKVMQLSTTDDLGWAWHTRNKFEGIPIIWLKDNSLNTALHELSHSFDLNLRNWFDDYHLGSKSKYKGIFDKKYYNDPTEIRARQNAIAAEMKYMGYNPNSKEEVIKFYNEMKKNKRPLVDFDIFKLYDKDNITNFRKYGGILK